MAKGMNTSGPNGGKGAKNTISTKAPSSPTRTIGFAAAQRPGAMKQHSSRGQTTQSSTKQAAVNRGVTTEYHTQFQNLSSTKVPSGQQYTKPKVNNGPFTNRSTQSSMTSGGKGKKGD